MAFNYEQNQNAHIEFSSRKKVFAQMDYYVLFHSKFVFESNTVAFYFFQTYINGKTNGSDFAC